MNNEILKKVDELIKEIEKSSEYQKYLSLKEQINKNKELMSLVNKVRLLQKDYVHHLSSKKELEEVTNELYNYPLYREYINTLDEINNIYTIIENSLNNYFESKLNDK